MQLSLIGKIDTYEKIKKIYAQQANVNLILTVKKFIARCQVGAHILDTSKSIMKCLKKYKKLSVILQQMCKAEELGESYQV